MQNNTKKQKNFSEIILLITADVSIKNSRKVTLDSDFIAKNCDGKFVAHFNWPLSLQLKYFK